MKLDNDRLMILATRARNYERMIANLKNEKGLDKLALRIEFAGGLSANVIIGRESTALRENLIMTLHAEIANIANEVLAHTAAVKKSNTQATQEDHEPT